MKFRPSTDLRRLRSGGPTASLRGRSLHLLVCCGLLLALVSSQSALTLAQPPSPEPSAPPVEQVRSALAQLDRWLGTGPGAAGWKEYLGTEALAAQLDRADQADWDVVDRVADRLHSGQPGLERAQFQRLRRAVDLWLEQLPGPAPAGLPALAREAGSGLSAITPAEVARARQQAQRSMADLERFLAQSPRNAAGWRAYVGWKDLQAVLAAAEPDQAKLHAIVARLRIEKPGLDLPEFRRLADALEVYGDLADASTNAQFVEQLRQELETVAAGLEKLAQRPDPAAAEEVGLRLGYLQRVSRGGPLVRAARRAFGRPNLLVQASEPLVAAGIATDVSDRAPVVDVILGTRIRGTGDTTGKVALRLVPHPHQARMEMVFDGQTQASTVGVNGPATIRNSSTTKFQARKLLTLDEGGFKAGPATVAANLSSRINGISGGGGLRGRIVQRTAQDRAYASKPRADAIARDHAEDRVRNRFDARVASQLAKSNDDFRRKVRQPLEAERAFPRALRYSTSDKYLHVTAVQANDEQLSTLSAAPELPSGLDLATVVHETMVNNLAQALLAGETRTRDEMEQGLLDAFGKLPKQLERDADGPPWTITFAAQRPITVDFKEGNLVTVILRGDKFQGGDNDLPAFDVTATYRLERDGEVLKAVRQGDIEIVPPDFVPGEGRRLSSAQAAQANTLRRRMEKFFEPEIVTDPLVLPGRWRNAGVLGLEAVDTRGDWLRLGWNRTGRPAPPEERPATPRRAAR